MIYVNISLTSFNRSSLFSLCQYIQSEEILLALLCFKYHGGASPSPTEGAEIRFCVRSCVPVFVK
jgi:hypothetical protein